MAKSAVFLPYGALRIIPGGIPLLGSFVAIKSAGADGVEVHLAACRNTSRRVINRQVLEYLRRAEALGLQMHLHQAWTLRDNPTHWHNWLLHYLRQLPREGMGLSDQLPYPLISMGMPCVLYAEHYANPQALTAQHWFQTRSSFGLNGRYRVSYAAFAAFAQRLRLPVVFDTQHVLEWRAGVRGVEWLPDRPAHLLAELLAAWRELGPLVREIHLSDCVPGGDHTIDRNVFVGEGRLPLREFCGEIKRDWEGVVVPEVGPRHLIPWSRQLPKLVKRTREYFA
ncbi:hypothetical protein C4552_00850 [Candidatus Parcubacteria bacterium]|nr:MAG: hypothetical protein C4552_00850 [Candidatus Parcubacteria bacterium]